MRLDALTPPSPHKADSSHSVVQLNTDPLPPVLPSLLFRLSHTLSLSDIFASFIKHWRECSRRHTASSAESESGRTIRKVQSILRSRCTVSVMENIRERCRKSLWGRRRDKVCSFNGAFAIFTRRGADASGVVDGSAEAARRRQPSTATTVGAWRKLECRRGQWWRQSQRVTGRHLFLPQSASFSCLKTCKR